MIKLCYLYQHVLNIVVMTEKSHSWRIQQISCGTMSPILFIFFSYVVLFNVSFSTKSQLCIMKTFF